MMDEIGTAPHPLRARDRRGRLDREVDEHGVEAVVRSARLIGFSAGLVAGVSWMLLVLFVSDRLVG